MPGEAIEPCNDLEVTRPRWDNHFVDMVPESDDATNSRTKVMHQAGRRVIHRGRNARATDGTDGTGAIAERPSGPLGPELLQAELPLRTVGPGQSLERPTGPIRSGQSLAERPTRPSTRQQPAEPPLGSGTQSCWHEDTDQSTRTGDSSGGSDSRDTRSDRTRSRVGDLVVIALEATIERVSTGASTTAHQHWQASAS